jgi:hypothetical protein
MIDLLYNKLTSSNNESIVEWKDINPTIFNKHSQYSHYFNIKEEKIIDTIVKPNVIEKVIVKPNVIEKVIVKPNVIEKVIVKPNVIEKVNENVLNKHQSKNKKKDESIKPLDIIINETTSFNNSTEYIKEALVKMISTEEFSKIFGLTKCAEIMSGVVNNRWNKSTALFISFLLDKEVYYNEKIIIYNKENNRGRITIAKL